MELGVFIFDTDYSIPIDELARALEDRGFASLYVPEHTHIPTSRKSPWPGGGELPKEYSHTLDPFVSLSFAAAATTNLKLGTGISLIPQRDPIVTAKAVASLDMMSNGRFTLGIGGGWNIEEMEHHGATYKTRFKLMRERVLAMKALWTEDEASFEGEMVRFESSWSWPKPLQKPHPPIILGGETKYTLQRVAEFCDGWLPRVTPAFDPQKDMERLRQAAEEAGRDPSELSVTLFRAPADAQRLEACAQAGISGGLFQLPSADRETVLPMLDDYAKLLNS